MPPNCASTEDQVLECRVALRVIEAATWRGREVPQTEIDDVLHRWRQRTRRKPLPFFIRDLQPRQLALPMVFSPAVAPAPALRRGGRPLGSFAPVPEKRVCTGCGQEKPATSLYFPLRRRRDGALVPRSRCHACEAERRRELIDGEFSARR